jgi:Sulfatase
MGTMKRRYWVIAAISCLLAVLFLTSTDRLRQARQRPNVILISIDTLRADHLGTYGYASDTSPFIDSIARRGAVFDDVTVPMPATDPSHAAMLTGLHPVKTGLLSNAMVLAPEVETLAEVLREAGYATWGATGVYHLSSRHGFGQGFDRFEAVPLEAAVRRPADAVNADVVRWIQESTAERSDRPLFLFVHYFDVHYPYINHEHPERFPGDTSLRSTIEAYDSGVRFVDAHIRSIWSALERADRASNTIIVITSDHGEQLGEHGVIAGHLDLYQETIRVPLIIAGPGIAPRRIRDTVSSMDIGPTILEAVGRSFSGRTDGRSLARLLDGRARAADADRPLLVLGYPHYVRSLALRYGSLFYVRNLEWVYRSITVGPIPATERPPGAVARRAESVTEGKRRVFTIPAVDFEPYQIIVDVRSRSDCKVDLGISLPSGVELAGTLTIQGPARIRYAVARLDSSFITAEPGACVDGVTWTFERLVSPELASAAEKTGVPTRLFDTMATMRKHSLVDELFDVMQDPAMTKNLIGAVDRSRVDTLEAMLEATFEDHGARVSPTRFSMPPEEVERLRSLGYIR